MAVTSWRSPQPLRSEDHVIASVIGLRMQRAKVQYRCLCCGARRGENIIKEVSYAERSLGRLITGSDSLPGTNDAEGVSITKQKRNDEAGSRRVFTIESGNGMTRSVVKCDKGGSKRSKEPGLAVVRMRMRMHRQTQRIQTAARDAGSTVKVKLSIVACSLLDLAGGHGQRGEVLSTLLCFLLGWPVRRCRVTPWPPPG